MHDEKKYIGNEIKTLEGWGERANVIYTNGAQENTRDWNKIRKNGKKVWETVPSLYVYARKGLFLGHEEKKQINGLGTSFFLILGLI